MFRYAHTNIIAKDHSTLEIFSYDTMENSCSVINKCGIAHLAFEVDDVEKTLQLLLQKRGRQIGELIKTKYENGECGCVKLTVYQSTDNSTHPALYIRQRNRQHCDRLEKIGRK